MKYFLKTNKSLVTYSFLILIMIPIIGIKIFVSFLGNILLLLFLIPVLLLILVFLGFNFYKSKVNICSECGSISFGFNETCIRCGADLEDINKTYNLDNKPSEKTVEIEAEEIL